MLSAKAVLGCDMFCCKSLCVKLFCLKILGLYGFLNVMMEKGNCEHWLRKVPFVHN